MSLFEQSIHLGAPSAMLQVSLLRHTQLVQAEFSLHWRNLLPNTSVQADFKYPLANTYAEAGGLGTSLLSG
jgi:hypothetical protein